VTPPNGADPELDELSRRLDAAFDGTRPSPGYADRLWARITTKPTPATPPPRPTPWWRRLTGRGPLIPALGGAMAALLLAAAVVAAINLGHERPASAPGEGAQSTSQPRGAATPTCPAPAAASPTPERGSPRPSPTPSPTPSGGTSEAAAPSTRC
jgi:hypothetical protein